MSVHGSISPFSIYPKAKTCCPVMKVRARAITFADKVIDLQAGSTPADLYLNDGATGGTFISADLVVYLRPMVGNQRIKDGPQFER